MPSPTHGGSVRSANVKSGKPGWQLIPPNAKNSSLAVQQCIPLGSPVAAEVSVLFTALGIY